MSEQPPARESKVKRSRWPGWIWAVPVAAVGVLLWLGLRALIEAGPSVTVTFTTPGELQPGQTKVEHDDVKVGTVGSVSLTKDLHHVKVTLNLDSSVADALGPGTRFWVVKPSLDALSLSSLSTLISGPYIEMDPHPGKAQQHFKGLDQPPVIPAGEPGTTYVLQAPGLESVGQGSVVTYRGIEVGKVQGYTLSKNGRAARIFVFVRAPYDRLVRRGSRFWNESGIEFGQSGGGLTAQLSSVKALILGGIAFDTPDALADGPKAPPNSAFPLFASRSIARIQPVGAQLLYQAVFPRPEDGLGADAEVKLFGDEIGRVTDVHLHFDPASSRLATLVTFAIEPGRLRGSGLALPAAANDRAAVDGLLDRLIREGLRARVSSSTPVLGAKEIDLVDVPNAGSAQLDTSGSPPEIPTAPGGGFGGLATQASDVMAQITAMQLPQIGKQVRGIADHLNRLTASPEIAQAVARLDRSLGNIEKLSATASRDIGPLVRNLRSASAEADRAVASASGLIGGGAGQDRNLPAALHELTDAARSIRALADYLDRHPEALIHGRSAPG